MSVTVEQANKEKENENEKVLIDTLVTLLSKNNFSDLGTAVRDKMLSNYMNPLSTTDKSVDKREK